MPAHPPGPGPLLAAGGAIAFSGKAIIVKLAYRASLERLILYLNPTLVLLFGVLFFGQRAGVAQLLALAVSYAGVLLVFGHELTVTGPQSPMSTAWGAALVFGSAVSYAVYLVYSGQEVKRLGALRLTGWATLVACGLCLLQFVLLRLLSAAVVAPEVLALSLLNATLCTFAPVVMVMLAIERVGATLTAQVGMIGPLSTVLLGAWLLDEALNLWIAAGTALVLLGVGLLARARPAGVADIKEA